MKIINLTPHTLTFMNADNRVLFTVSSSGIARATQTRVCTGAIESNGFSIPVNASSYGEVSGLPDPEEGTIYIVSALTAQAVPERKDVFITDDAVRDEQGRVIGCRAIAHI